MSRPQRHQRADSVPVGFSRSNARRKVAAQKPQGGAQGFSGPLSIGGAAFAVQVADRQASIPRQRSAKSRHTRSHTIAVHTRSPRRKVRVAKTKQKKPVQRPKTPPAESKVAKSPHDDDKAGDDDGHGDGDGNGDGKEADRLAAVARSLLLAEESDDDGRGDWPNKLFMSGHEGLGEDLMGTYLLCPGRGYNGRPK